jgi:ABC-type cobalt transport system substrate-binding protein
MIIIILIIVMVFIYIYYNNSEQFTNQNISQTHKEIADTGINCQYSPFSDALHCKAYPEWWFYTANNIY